MTTVSATDADGNSPNNMVQYLLETGPGADKFQVNSTSGVISVGPGALLDRETDQGNYEKKRTQLFLESYPPGFYEHNFS